MARFEELGRFCSETVWKNDSGNAWGDCQYKSVSDDETCNLGVCYKEILDDIDISSDIGTKLYEFACKQAENRSCTKLELLFEVLDMAGFINKLCLDSKKRRFQIMQWKLWKKDRKNIWL